tara:strand:- start:2972 stop:3559 length:588 start_codon:yes stop_codon:yes gene_type:complete
MSEETKTQAENLGQLREDAKNGKDAIAEMEGMRRQVAFSQAGFDINDAGVQMAMRGYSGEMNAEAINEAVATMTLTKVGGQPQASPQTELNEDGTPISSTPTQGDPEYPNPTQHLGNTVDDAQSLASGTPGDQLQTKGVYASAMDIAKQEADTGGEDSDVLAVAIASAISQTAQGRQDAVLAADGTIRDGQMATR